VSHRDAIPDDLPRLPYNGSSYDTLRIDVTIGELMDGSTDPQSSALVWGDAVARFVQALGEPPERPPAFVDHTPTEIRRTRIGECADGLMDPNISPTARQKRLRTAKETVLILQTWVLAKENRLTEFGYDSEC
jgi:hypothetical protein